MPGPSAGAESRRVRPGADWSEVENTAFFGGIEAAGIYGEPDAAKLPGLAETIRTRTLAEVTEKWEFHYLAKDLAPEPEQRLADKNNTKKKMLKKKKKTKSTTKSATEAPAETAEAEAGRAEDPPPAEQRSVARWTEEENDRFRDGLRDLGMTSHNIAKARELARRFPNKTEAQVITKVRNHFQALKKQKTTGEEKPHRSVSRWTGEENERFREGLRDLGMTSNNIAKAKELARRFPSKTEAQVITKVRNHFQALKKQKTTGAGKASTDHEFLAREEMPAVPGTRKRRKPSSSSLPPPIETAGESATDPKPARKRRGNKSPRGGTEILVRVSTGGVPSPEPLRATLGVRRLRPNERIAGNAPEPARPSRSERIPPTNPPAPTGEEGVIPGEEEKKSEDDCPRGPKPFPVEEDPNEHYVEEEAHLYHNPPMPSYLTKGVLPEEIQPVPPPPPLPPLPDTGSCRWSYHPEQRVLLADFSVATGGAGPMDPVDEAFLKRMMERDDVTVVSEGLLDWEKMDPRLWNLNHICTSMGQAFFHRFRRFDTEPLADGTEKILEVDVAYSMRMIDYGRYLELRRRCQTSRSEHLSSEFEFVDHTGEKHTLNAERSALYMIDLDLNRLLPNLGASFDAAFRYKPNLPGGSNCMMNKVTPSARPFMGPNLYVTPPASFTHFHQDGHGTVDSGHLVISGYNEVIMLRRLTERHKRHALWLLTGTQDEEKPPGQKPGHDFFDGLYSEPHGDDLGEKPKWPSRGKIEKCEKMGYCPSVLLLKPGQLIHINKGRIHAFRKMSIAPLPEEDCHSELRRRMVAKEGLETEELCVSIAWDWMYSGFTSNGINREVLTVLEAAILNRKRARVSLAIPELSLLRMAQFYAPPATDFGLAPIIQDGRGGNDDEKRRRVEVCRGILPGLRYVVRCHEEALTRASDEARESTEPAKRISFCKLANTDEVRSERAIDPYGNGDFACKLCSKELSNVYFRCDGCEKHLSKDFNICSECYSQQHFRKKILMHSNQIKNHAKLNHTGNMKYDRNSRQGQCPCKNGPDCKFCGFCLGCSCRCHSWFTLKCRVIPGESEKEILKRVEETAKEVQFLPNDAANDRYLDDSEFTFGRLAAAKHFWGHDDDLIL